MKVVRQVTMITKEPASSVIIYVRNAMMVALQTALNASKAMVCPEF